MARRRVQKRLRKLARLAAEAKNPPNVKRKRPPRRNKQRKQSWIDSFYGTYHDYLQSPQWSERRQRALNLHGRKCSICGSKYDLHVHHLTYINLFHEPLKDLAVLCQGCHENEHEGKNGVVADPMTRAYLELDL